MFLIAYYTKDFVLESSRNYIYIYYDVFRLLLIKPRNIVSDTRSHSTIIDEMITAEAILFRNFILYATV